MKKECVCVCVKLMCIYKYETKFLTCHTAVVKTTFNSTILQQKIYLKKLSGESGGKEKYKGEEVGKVRAEAQTWPTLSLR